MSEVPTITEVPLSIELMRRHDLSREECIIHGLVVAFARLNMRPTLRQLVGVAHPELANLKRRVREPQIRNMRRRLSRLVQLQLVRCAPEAGGVTSRYWPGW